MFLYQGLCASESHDIVSGLRVKSQWLCTSPESTPIATGHADGPTPERSNVFLLVRRGIYELDPNKIIHHRGYPCKLTRR